MNKKEFKEKLNKNMQEFVKEQLIFNELYKKLDKEDQIDILDEYNYQLKYINGTIQDLLDKYYKKEEK